MDALLIGDGGVFGDTKWLVILALIIGTITILNAYGRRRRSAGASPRTYSREVDSATRQSMVIKRDLEALLVEINELSRVINGQLDTRFAKLEISIADADRRIAELRSLLIKAGIEPDESGAQSPATAEIVTPRLDVVIDDGADAGVSSRDAAAGLREAPPDCADSEVPARVEEKPDDAPESEVDRFHLQVRQLADEGRSPVEIAEITQHAVGEVELVLHLRRRAMRRNAAVDPLPADRRT